MSPSGKKGAPQQFSYVFQETALFDFLTVVEERRPALAERKRPFRRRSSAGVRDKLSQLDLYDVDHKYPRSSPAA